MGPLEGDEINVNISPMEKFKTMDGQFHLMANILWIVYNL